MRWNPETKTLEITFVDLEHIAGHKDLHEGLEGELFMGGLEAVKPDDIHYVLVRWREHVMTPEWGREGRGGYYQYECPNGHRLVASSNYCPVCGAEMEASDEQG